MLRRPAIVIALIAFIVGALAVLLYIAHDRIVSAPSKDAPGALFWMEVSKPILQTLLGGGIIVGLLKLLFDSVQSRRQLQERVK